MKNETRTEATDFSEMISIAMKQFKHRLQRHYEDNLLAGRWIKHLRLTSGWRLLSARKWRNKI